MIFSESDGISLGNWVVSETLSDSGAGGAGAVVSPVSTTEVSTKIVSEAAVSKGNVSVVSVAVAGPGIFGGFLPKSSRT